MRALVTGAAGFIGFHLARKLSSEGHEIVCCDDLNDYYDIELKLGRLNALGFDEGSIPDINNSAACAQYNNLKFYRGSIGNKGFLNNIFQKENFDIVINLAAQAGVRYSIQNPQAYVDSNITGFLNILEMCKNFNISNICYASSSSVYGLSNNFPLDLSMNTDSPISIYAASKKSNELFAHTYASLYKMSILGLRFFTVYGPWGRPDMAYFKFTKAAYDNQSIDVYNHGEMERDFTYIDDITNGIILAMKYNLNTQKLNNHEIFNLGNSSPETIASLLDAIEINTGKTLKKNYIDMQPGDVKKTYADISKSTHAFNFNPSVNLDTGIEHFVSWYKQFYLVD